MTEDQTEIFLWFYHGDGVDHRGRKLHQIIGKPDAWLERTHDYIQWLFPLPTPSQFNPEAPILNEEIRAAFTSSN